VPLRDSSNSTAAAAHGGRGTHTYGLDFNGLDALVVGITTQKVNFILDASQRQHCNNCKRITKRDGCPGNEVPEQAETVASAEGIARMWYL
jgi:hypothetical protein